MSFNGNGLDSNSRSFFWRIPRWIQWTLLPFGKSFWKEKSTLESFSNEKIKRGMYRAYSHDKEKLWHASLHCVLNCFEMSFLNKLSSLGNAFLFNRPISTAKPGGPHCRENNVSVLKCVMGQKVFPFIESRRNGERRVSREWKNPPQETISSKESERHEAPLCDGTVNE